MELTPLSEVPCEVKELEGRGRGLCATRHIARGEKLFVSSCFGYAVLDSSASPQQLCHGCLGFSEVLAVRCSGCGTTYCSELCMELDLVTGHEFCCQALARMATVGHRKTTLFERSAACFLLRAFARRRAMSGTGPNVDANAASNAAADAPTFDDALRQCNDHDGIDGFARRESQRERAVRLAVLQAGRLVNRDEALRLLLVEPQNSYSLRDPTGALRGWLMYPRASMMNHSCLPNCGCVVEGVRVTFYALVDIAAGVECTQCYLQLPEKDSYGAPSTSSWGFECNCPRCVRSAHSPESLRAIAAFDAEHRCACGCIVVPSMAVGKVCRCHEYKTRSASGQTAPPRAVGLAKRTTVKCCGEAQGAAVEATFEAAVEDAKTGQAQGEALTPDEGRWALDAPQEAAAEARAQAAKKAGGYYYVPWMLTPEEAKERGFREDEEVVMPMPVYSDEEED